MITRLPVRFTFNNRYFSDRYEGFPICGYGKLLERMANSNNIMLACGVDYFDLSRRLTANKLLVYTGPIDRFFSYKYGMLGWRTLKFEREVVHSPDFQGCSVMNYADEETPYTRIHEFRHLHPERSYGDRTIIFREYSHTAKTSDEPYYPINSLADRRMYDAYRADARIEPNVLFGGRLGTYRYLDMHQAIGAALKLWKLTILPHFVAGTAPHHKYK